MDPASNLFLQRKKKLEYFLEKNINPFPNDFKPTHTARQIHERFGSLDHEQLFGMTEEFMLAGRIIALRDFGKTTFLHIMDRSGKIQAYVHKDRISHEDYEVFKKLDIGDIIGLKGRVFKTKTHELTIDVNHIRLLSKSLRPLPEKWHGLRDKEIRYRQRYLDLIVNPHVKEVFIKRAKIIQLIRKFLEERDFLEVETPMFHPIPGGALARPFKTYHNALDMELYLRIAPELYLKKLVIGGLERVYEINRNFRNEGISTLHNPEFTMLEFYQAYADYRDFMDLTEQMGVMLAEEIMGQLCFSYLDHELDFTPPWARKTFKEAIEEFGGIGDQILENPERTKEYAKSLGILVDDTESHGKTLQKIFDQVVEPHLIQPTFITNHPVEISPLARKRDENPEEVERFELYIAKTEIANAFSELNDPFDQRERFLRQVEERGEGMEILDEDYLKALEYSLPPTAGEGIGIDRLVMILTNCSSIRDVILFPLLRKEQD